MGAVFRTGIGKRAVPAAVLLLALALLAYGAATPGGRARLGLRAAPAVAEPVYLVHGVQWSGGSDCARAWGTAGAELRRYGFRGPIVTWGYYKADRNCTRRYDGSLNTTIKELGRRLAWDVHLNHSRRNRPVSVLGHSMGGLITAAALAGVRKYGGRSTAWPPYLLVRNAVTLGTPFRGVTCGHTYVQCTDLRAGSRFLRWLAAFPDPQGRSGTDWTLMAAEDDTRVPPASGLAAAARHKVRYLAGQRLGHSALHLRGGGGRYRLRHSDDAGRTYRTTSGGTAPLRLAAAALYSGAR
ncbi:hypothetical protein ACFVH6_35015 [Spirillospora sp. NPDC127200]